MNGQPSACAPIPAHWTLQSSRLAVQGCVAWSLLFLALLLTLPDPAGAADAQSYPHYREADPHASDLQAEARHSDRAVLEELMDWLVARASSMSYRPELPAITRVSRRQLEALAFGSAYPAAVRPAPPAIHGLYNFENETIYLAHGIDLNGTQGRAIVLHELVHHLQYEYGFDADVRCVNELEPLAYEIEALYLGERQQPIGFSRAHVRRLSRCAASQRTSAAMRLPRERIAFQ